MEEKMTAKLDRVIGSLAEKSAATNQDVALKYSQSALNLWHVRAGYTQLEPKTKGAGS